MISLNRRYGEPLLFNEGKVQRAERSLILKGDNHEYTHTRAVQV